MRISMFVIQLETSSNFEIFFYGILKSCYYWKLYSEEEIHVKKLFVFLKLVKKKKKRKNWIRN